MMLNNKYYKFFLIFASVFLGLSLLNLPDVLGIDISKGQWDSITRLRVAIHDLEPSHKYITGTTWLPLHFYVIRFLYFIFGNLNTVLLMHYFFLITGISFIISLLHKKEDSISKLCILIFSSIILLNTPVLFYLSLTAHSEPLFFFILSLCIFYYLKENPNKKDIVITIILFNILNFIRYEGWIISGVLGILYYLRTRSFKKFPPYTLTSVIPILWVLYDYSRSGEWFSFFSIQAIDASVNTSILSANTFHSIYKLTGGLLYLILGIIPLFFLNGTKKKKSSFSINILITAIFITVYLLYKILTLQLFHDTRYFSTPTFLVVVYILIYVSQFSFSTYRNRLILLTSVLIWYPTSFLTQTIVKNFSYRNYATSGFYEGLEYIERLQLSKQDRLFIPRTRWYPDLIYLHTNLINSNKIFWPLDEDLPTQKDFTPTQLKYDKLGLFSKKQPTFIAVVKKEKWGLDFLKHYRLQLENTYSLEFENEFIKIFKRL